MKTLEKIINKTKKLACAGLVGLALLGGVKGAKADFVPDRLFVANWGANQVLESDKYGTVIREIGAGENYPTNMTFGPDLNLYVTNAFINNIHKYDDKGELLQVIGSGYLDFPTGLDFGPDNHLYVSSWGTNQIVEFDSSGNFVKAFDTVIDPQDVAVDSSGNIYVPDYYEGVINYNPRVMKYNSEGKLLATFGEDELYSPADVEIGPNGNIFVSNQYGGQGGGIYEYNLNSLEFERRIGNGYIGGIGPIHLAFDLENNLYISDWDNIVVYDFEGNYLRTLEGFNNPKGMEFSPIPEPASLVLVGSGLVGLLALQKYKKRKNYD